ncbi:hypothetical protein K402DRAFT_424907 [Aulographum hederae CBS 113979]|uniref:PH domain-containing protein n=1 Tax=Aulographum hederae CBS 113979 TaxID=1176131 RepID=A0A6G1GM79_9PEZI|nr:hypothetical protein K402DRAFT_424907 [Aulographum hederae CBS 113979]
MASHLQGHVFAAVASANNGTPAADSAASYFSDSTSANGTLDYAPTAGNPGATSPLAHSFQQQGHGFDDGYGASERGYEGDGLKRTPSAASTNYGAGTGGLSRGNTLKKKNSLSKKASIKRSGSRKSMRAGSIKGVMADGGASSGEHNDVFYTPIPTSGTPTDILAARFQNWRKFLKDLIAYFRDVQTSYEHRSKAILKVSNIMNNTNAPSVFASEGGINDANHILRDYHKQSLSESNKAKEIQTDVVNQLSGLRSDLGQKIKEIKSLSGDFKNSVDKEKEGTRKAVNQLHEALASVDSDPHGSSGKDDPYVVRLGVDRQVEKQIDEENYLHRAYLNLEGSGRELESIVIGEIQKAYNALAGILKREADENYAAIERLRSGPIIMPKDHEWVQFVDNDTHFVSPNVPMRRLEDIEYPGKHHPAAAEVRAGMLERKSKYLKSYTPGWYVLSPTHLHEFKSADKIYSQPPVMSLVLADQKLGSHSQPGSSSHKFILRGKQAGTMHRGHSWVFRAESYDTMLAWYDDIKTLTETSGEARNSFVRKHARSFSASSHHRAGSISGDSGMEEDEADAVPYSASASMAGQQQSMSAAAAREHQQTSQRPQPGGRFPSDIQVNRHLHAPLSPSSGSSDYDHDLTTGSGGAFMAGGAGTAAAQQHQYQPQQETGAPPVHSQGYGDNVMTDSRSTPMESYNQPPPAHYQQYPTYTQPTDTYQGQPDGSDFLAAPVPHHPVRQNSDYGDWMAPAAGGAAIGAGAVAAGEYGHGRGKQVEEAPTNSPSFNAPAVYQPTSSATETRDFDATGEKPVTVATATSGESAAGVSTAPTSLSGVSSSVADEGVDKQSRGTGLKETGTIFPSVLRHDTDMSVRDLHVPGEWGSRA